MNRDQVLTEIAQRILGLKTLEERHSDRLDFKEFSVWRVKQALSAAYDAGFQAGQQRSETEPNEERRT